MWQNTGQFHGRRGPDAGSCVHVKQNVAVKVSVLLSLAIFTLPSVFKATHLLLLRLKYNQSMFDTTVTDDLRLISRLWLAKRGLFLTTKKNLTTTTTKKFSYFINQSSSDSWHFYRHAWVWVLHVTVKPQCFLYWFFCLISSQPETTAGSADILERKHHKKKVM